MPYKIPELEWQVQPLPAPDAVARWARAIKILAKVANRLSEVKTVDSSTNILITTHEKRVKESPEAESKDDTFSG